MKLDSALPVMLWSARPDMSCAQVNRAWLEFTGLAEEQALAAGCAGVVHPEDLARWLDASLRAFDSRESFEVEYRMRHHDGEYRWVLERAVPRLSAAGEFLGYVGACVDIDERKRAQLELLAAVLAERSSPLLSALLSGIRVRVVEDEAANDDGAGSERLVKVPSWPRSPA